MLGLKIIKVNSSKIRSKSEGECPNPIADDTHEQPLKIL